MTKRLFEVVFLKLGADFMDSFPCLFENLKEIVLIDVGYSQVFGSHKVMPSRGRICFDFSEIDLRMRLKSEVDWRSKQAKSDVTNINQIRIICHRHNNEFGGYYDKKRLRKEIQIVPRRGNAQ